MNIDVNMLILGSKRNAASYTKLKRQRAMGFFNVIIPKDKKDYTQDETPRHVRDWLEMRNNVTVRLSVTIPTTGIYFYFMYIF
jgi:hypothetical protein